MQEIDYYAVLNVKRNATIEEITLAYRKAAVKFHPQKDSILDIAFNPPDGIDDEDPLPALPKTTKWMYINKAYDILSHPLRRSIYDSYGEAGLQYGVPLPNGFFSPYKYHEDCGKTYKEVFGSFSPYGNLIDACINPPPLFSTNNGTGIKMKDNPIQKLIYLSLEEIYFGGIKKMKILRQEFNDESQTSTSIREKDLTVPIGRGILPGTRITFPNEGHRHPTRIPSDIIFIIAELPHNTFHRKGADLFIDYEITLKRALCGFNLTVQSIDGRKLNLAINDIVHTEYVKVLPNEGLPVYTEPLKRGSLFLRFEIDFPNYIPRTLRIKFANLFDELERIDKEPGGEYPLRRTVKLNYEIPESNKTIY